MHETHRLSWDGAVDADGHESTVSAYIPAPAAY